MVFFHGWEEKLAQIILKNKLFCFFMRQTFGKAKKIVVLAEKVAQQLIDMGIDKNKIVLMSTMFDGALFDGIKKKSVDNKITLLFLSRFAAGKGLMELLDAFNSIRIRHPEVSLHLVGDGSEKLAVEKKISALNLKENVTLPGYIHGKEKAQELVDADIFILPSYSEGCPVALLEAMAAGLPIIATNVGGIPDIITDGENGVLLTSHTPDAIENGINKMLENKINRQKIGMLNKKIAWENYESKVATPKLEKIYKKIVTLE
jgi:glycosyltransferase involved in cell wall biosynthesis